MTHLPHGTDPFIIYCGLFSWYGASQHDMVFDGAGILNLTSPLCKT